MVISKFPENMLMEYQQDNAYLKRAFDLQEQFITSLHQQIAELRNENTILSGQTVALQNENNLLCEKTITLQNEKNLLCEKLVLNKQTEENLRNLLTETQNNTAAIQAERDNIDKQFYSLHIENTGLCNEIKQLQEGKCLLKQEISSLQKERELLVNALNGIQNSTIWKWTEPLRKIIDFVKGIRKRKSFGSNMTDER